MGFCSSSGYTLLKNVAASGAPEFYSTDGFVATLEQGAAGGEKMFDFISYATLPHPAAPFTLPTLYTTPVALSPHALLPCPDRGPAGSQQRPPAPPMPSGTRVGRHGRLFPRRRRRRLLPLRRAQPSRRTMRRRSRGIRTSSCRLVPLGTRYTGCLLTHPGSRQSQSPGPRQSRSLVGGCRRGASSRCWW